MSFSFCPHCGTKLQPDFRFCPSCGEKIPCPVDDSPGPAADAAPGPVGCSTLSGSPHDPNGGSSSTSGTALEIGTRPPLRKTRGSVRLVHEEKPTFCVPLPTSPFTVASTLVSDDYTVPHTPPRKVTWNLREEMESALESSSPPVSLSRSPRSVMGKERASKRLKQQDEDQKLTERTFSNEENMLVDSSSTSPLCSPSSRSSTLLPCSPSSRSSTSLPCSPSSRSSTSLPCSPSSRSPSRGKGKAKKNKRSVNALEPLQEGEELTDTTGRKWRLMKLLSQSATELFYEVASVSGSKGSSHVLKLGAKDGRIFNEQNFLQRAAKPSSVDKWKKRLKMDFLGIPSCVGFGLHADNYRFLIFPNMGQPLQSSMEEEELLSEKVILHLACTILDVLEYIHSNEYVHGDIHAENVYITLDEHSQVYLAGYCHAFRYCPGGQHVEYREASRTLHEGAMEFISLDSHKGAGPSRRSDLQSLGYCLLRWHTGTLPWTALTNADQIAKEKHRYMDDVSALLSHCFGKKRVSAALQTYLTSVMALDYSETPDYTGLKAGLSGALLQLGGSLEQKLHF